MSQQENEQINIGKTRIIEGNGQNFAMLVKNTISIQSAITLINSLSDLVEELGEDSEEKLSLTTFLKDSKYGDSFFGNMLVDVVKKPEESKKTTKKKFSPKNSKAKENSKSRINSFKQASKG